jgi:hypothetical protein
MFHLILFLQEVLKKLNTTGVVYRPSGEKISDNNTEEDVATLEGCTFTHSHCCEAKDFMDRADDSSDNVNSVHDGTSIKEKNTTPSNIGATPDVPIVVGEDVAASHSSSTIPMKEFTDARNRMRQDKNFKEAEAAAEDSDSLDSRKSMCRKAMQGGKREGVGEKRKRTEANKSGIPANRGAKKGSANSVNEMVWYIIFGQSWVS